MGKLVSVVNECISFYPQIDVSFQENLICLIDTNKPKDIVESRFVSKGQKYGQHLENLHM